MSTGSMRCWHNAKLIKHQRDDFSCPLHLRGLKMPVNARSLWMGCGLLSLAALSWSTAGLFPRLVSTDVFTTLFWRSLLGGISVLMIHLAILKRPDSRPFWQTNGSEKIMACCSAMAMIFFIAAFYYASVAEVVFVYSAFPILTVVISAVLLGTSVRRIDVVSTCLVITGVVIILRGQASLQGGLGTQLSLGATVLFALLTIGIKRYPDADMVRVTYIGAFMSAAAMWPFSNFTDTTISNTAWLWLYGFLNIGVGFGLFLLGVRHINATLAALICMIEIPLAPLWAYMLFDETVAVQTLVGGAVIVSAVLVNLAWPHQPEVRTSATD